MKTTSVRIFDRQFWMIGLAFVVVGLIAFATCMQQGSSEASAARRAASTVLRSTYPDLAWAFDESDKCNEGTGNFAGKRYYTREACDKAVAEIAKSRGGDSQQILKLFALRDRAADAQ